MTRVLFYEKPGCINNSRQKALLVQHGHEVEARSLLEQRWSVEQLRPFFRGLPVVQWFNTTAPRIKSGEIDPCQVGEEEALGLMVDDPLLIRRPLMEINGIRLVGFEPARQLLGLAEQEGDLEGCARTHGACPTPG